MDENDGSKDRTKSRRNDDNAEEKNEGYAKQYLIGP